MGNELEQSGLEIRLGPEGEKLFAAFTPVVGRRSLDAAALRRAVDEEGFGELLISPDAVDELLKRCEVSPVAFSLQIGERRDATLALTVADDYMSATVTVTPARGGGRVTREEILKELADRGVVHGILEQEVDAVVAAGEAVKVQVAAGTPPIPGEDTQFISLIPEGRELVPQLSENDTADYRNLGDVFSVSLGAPLIRRTSPTQGVPGMNLLGVELSAPDGVELSFADNLTGVACDLHDCDLLIAACSGFPRTVPRGMIVEPVLTLKRVDLSTGNLRVNGSLEIQGDICEGMSVSATENIVVGGIVEGGARLEAGGDIEVGGGVVGHVTQAPGKNQGRREATQLKAEGKVTVQFAENALISAAAGITVRELAMQSELISGAGITVGEPGGRKGHIIGGLSRAASLVHAIVLGSHAGVPTVVEVGVDPALKMKMGSVQEALEEKAGRMEELEKTLAYVKEHPGSMEPGLLALKQRVFAKLSAEMAELNGEKKRLQKRMEINAQARVEVERHVFLGVQIRIGGACFQIEEDLMGPTFTLGAEGVEYSC